MSDLPKIGMDIGATSIKLCELAPVGREKWKLLAAASVATPVGGVMGGSGNVVAIVQSIARVIKEAGIRSRKVIAALPEEQVSSHVVEMPDMSDDEVRQALQWQVEQYIPIPADRAVWSHQIISRDKNSGGMEVLLVAAAKNLVEQYTNVLEQAGLEVVALETQLMAVARALVPAGGPLAVLLDMGARSANIGVVAAGQLVFARTVPTGGDALTRAIEVGLGLDHTQAEQYRNAYGFAADKLEGKVAAVLSPILNQIAGEIKKTIDFYSSKHSGDKVQSIILSGGVTTLPQFISNLSAAVGVEVMEGNPFLRVIMNQNQSKALSGAGPVYVEAVGLAMRAI